MKKILIAEDDELLREMTEEVLRRSGYEVFAACDGLQAWEHLKSQGADIAVLDVNMPNMNGIELLRRIRSDDKHKNMPVLMLTIKAGIEDQIAGYDIGADDYVIKPFNNEVLSARVKALERRIGKTKNGE